VRTDRRGSAGSDRETGFRTRVAWRERRIARLAVAIRSQPITRKDRLTGFTSKLERADGAPPIRRPTGRPCRTGDPVTRSRYVPAERCESSRRGSTRDPSAIRCRRSSSRPPDRRADRRHPHSFPGPSVAAAGGPSVRSACRFVREGRQVGVAYDFRRCRNSRAAYPSPIAATPETYGPSVKRRGDDGEASYVACIALR
jgi:hypothetical protein